MTLFISKRVMLIYNLIIRFSLLVIVQSSFAADDMASFCFEPTVSLKAAKESIGFLLLPKDSVAIDEETHCLDIVTSDARKNLLEKYLSKKFKLISAAPQEKGECHLELRTITTKKQEAQDFKLGQKNNLSVNESSTNAVMTSEMLLGAGFAGTLATGIQILKVECRPSGDDAFDLVFFFEEKSRANVSTTVRLKKNEVMNIATVRQILDDKNKTLGIPQTAIVNNESTEEINYELKVY